MPRPIKLRNVCSLPQNCHFGPLDGESVKDEIIVMTVDEYETIRLIDLEGLTQEECSKQMNVARTTVQGIYNDARYKLAETLVNGKRLIIEGGEYRICNGMRNKCGRTCHRMDCIANFIKKENGVMKIAIPADENKKDSSVCMSFARAPYFAVYNDETKEIEFLDNSEAANGTGAGIKASQLLVDNNISVLIAPRMGENAAKVLRIAEIELKESNDKNVEENIKDCLEGKLKELTKIHAGFHMHGAD